MNRYGNVESERPIVQHIDREEQGGTQHPFSEWHGRGSKEIAALGIELIMQCRQTSKDELEERDE
jgi:hypothetical protein